MKGKIDVSCVINLRSVRFDVKTHALIRNMNSSNKFGAPIDTLRVEPKHPLRLDIVQYLAAIHNKTNELNNNDGKITFRNLDCEFIYAKRKGTEEIYFALIVNLGTKEKPMIRAFYLTTYQVDILETYKLEHEFSLSELDYKSQDEEDEDDNQE